MNKIHLPSVAMIVAASKNNVIGINNQLPWHLPQDLSYFKDKTINNPIIMGRKTFESIGNTLPKRLNIIISNNPSYYVESTLVTNSLHNAINLAKNKQPNCNNIFIIGGSSIFSQCLDLIDKIYLTNILANIDGNSFLPKIDWDLWKQDNISYYKKDSKNQYDMEFILYHKKNKIK